MNLTAIARKLQKALLKKGVYVSINQYQRYSDKAERMVTKFVVTTPKYYPDEQKIKNVAVCESYRMIDVVQALAALLNGGGDPDC